MYNENRRESYKEIMTLYDKAGRLKYTVRMGRVLSHVNDPLPEEEVRKLPEMVAAHAYMLAVLTVGVMTHFPWTYEHQMDRFILSLVLTLLHDTAEGEFGDEPDNGNPKHDAAKVDEEKFMQEFFSNLPYWMGQNTTELFHEFERPATTEDAVALMLKLLDKLEAIWGLLNDEREGIVGDLYLWEEDPSPRDLVRAEYLGTSNPIDIWSYGLRRLMHDCQVPSQMQELILDLLEVKFVDVRGEKPNCLTYELTVA